MANPKKFVEPNFHPDNWWRFLQEAAIEVFHKKAVLKNYGIFTTVLESLFNKVKGLQACNFIKKRLQHRCFSVNIAKFLRASILKNIATSLTIVNLRQVTHKFEPVQYQGLGYVQTKLWSSDSKFITASVIKIYKFLSYFDSKCFLSRFFIVTNIFVVK